MFQNTRLVMMSATAIQMAAAAMSFVIILILRHQLSLDEFATISISLFLAAIVIPLANLNLGWKYFNMVRDMNLSVETWGGFAIFRLLVSAGLVLFCAWVGGAMPASSIALIFFLYLSMTELLPKGFFEAEESIYLAIAQFTERSIQIIMAWVDPAIFFQFCLFVRGGIMGSLWVLAYFKQDRTNLMPVTKEHFTEFVGHVRQYTPKGIMNTMSQQIPIWLGGVHLDPLAISNLAILRQATLFPRNFTTTVARIFHRPIAGKFMGFIMFNVGLLGLVCIGLLVFIWALKTFSGIDIRQIEPVLLIIWSTQITMTNLLAKRMALINRDTHLLIGSAIGLVLVICLFFVLKLFMSFTASYVIALVVSRLTSNWISYLLAKAAKRAELT